MPAPSRLAEGTRFRLRVATSVRSSATNRAAPTSSTATQPCRRANVEEAARSGGGTSTSQLSSGRSGRSWAERTERDRQDGPVSALAVALALAAAALFAVAAAAQQRSAAAVPDDRGPQLVLTLVRRPLWWVGTLADVGGYVAQAAPLGLGSLLLVQPLLVTGLLFALPLGARWAGRSLGRAELVWS